MGWRVQRLPLWAFPGLLACFQTGGERVQACAHSAVKEGGHTQLDRAVRPLSESPDDPNCTVQCTPSSLQDTYVSFPPLPVSPTHKNDR
ncbi:hypothetical protein BC939DRAFT_456583 [Gamsiella multidivaricata]|uniref:uncharacterized protein n=1 Tax=Gamsiella multidivaricata TaxID=101098 RepID=UPI00221ED045|nr:uncharacterized protein BC939DRAFT_456583 [Gamsiella multidivaricata]KAI7820923.1 hypothetical protein BC939DRAFT_456583 [Gamsiella multidivaricata]